MGRKTRRLMTDREAVKAVTEVTTLKGGRREVEVAGLRPRDKLGDSSRRRVTNVGGRVQQETGGVDD